MAETDYYKVLDVSRNATSAEIKTAYHRAAKRSHPDAGGNAEAMQRVNEAYATLSKALSRREYDAHRSAAPASHARPTASHPHPASQQTSTHHTRAYTHHPSLLAMARNSALRIVGYSVVVWAIFALILPYIYSHTPDPISKIIIALVAFAPLYTLAVGLVFLIKPNLRIAVAQIAAGHLPPRSDLRGLLAIVLAAAPLAAAWVVGFSAGLLK
jgi:hypothetical protein